MGRTRNDVGPAGARGLATAVCALVLFIFSTSTHGYTVTSIGYQWDNVAGTEVVLKDDAESRPIPLPFSFKFLRSFPFLVPYAQVSIGSNGYLTFLERNSESCSELPNRCTAQRLPSDESPNALVAGYWSDLDPTQGGSVRYATLGTAPLRRFVVEFDSVPHASSGADVSFQIKLFEGSNNIEIHCRSCQSNGAAFTQGIESEAVSGVPGGSNAVCYTTNSEFVLHVYGFKCSYLNAESQWVGSERNAASFSLTMDAVRFTPPNNRSGLVPIMSLGESPIVKLRYRFRVDRNDPVDGVGPDFKLLFEYTTVYNRQNYETGANRDIFELDTAFYAQGMRYADPLCYQGYVPPNQQVSFNREATFRHSVPDYTGKGLTGRKTNSPAAFPRATSAGLIDGIASGSSLISQFDVEGLDGFYLLSRAGIISDKTGWRLGATDCNIDGVCSCEDAGLDLGNPGRAFRQWDRTMTIGGEIYTTHEALPNDAATEIAPWNVIGFATEYYFTTGHFRIYLWDFAVQREGSSDWEPLQRWQVTDHDGSTRYYGYRLSHYDDQCVIEVSNDPTLDNHYLFGIGQASDSRTSVLDLAACTVSPTAMTGPPSVSGSSALALHAVVNANGAAGESWFEYGPTEMLGAKTAAQDIEGSSDSSVSALLATTAVSDPFFYRVVALTDGGEVAGAIRLLSSQLFADGFEAAEAP